MICFKFQVPAKKPRGDVGSLQAVSPEEDSSKSPEEKSEETGWPVFKDGDKVLPTEFKEGSWKCPYCCHWTVRIKQHLKTHLDKIQSWEAAEKFSVEVSQRKRKMLEEKRAQDPKRKETLIKAGKKADEKRAQDPTRRKTLRIANAKYVEKLGNLRKQAQNRKYEQNRVDREKGGDALRRRTRFLKAVMRGPEFVCSSCHRTLFKKSVSAVTEKLTEKMKKASEDRVKEQKPEEVKPRSKLRKRERKLPKENSRKSPEENSFELWQKFKITSVGNITYLCSTCKSALTSGKMPSMAVANGLEVDNSPDRPRLTELENNMIAQVINFQKIVVLRKSGWPAGKGKMISVPVPIEDVMNTVKQLPRLPEEAGLVPIKLKRKKQYKGHEKSEQVRPEQMFRALRYLKRAGHPYYQNYDTEEDYLARCRQRDRLKLLIREEEVDDLEEDLDAMKGAGGEDVDEADVEDEAVDDGDDEGEMDVEGVMEQEEEDIQNDPVRRQHFQYNQFSALVNGHPEIFVNSDGNQVANLDFAPAEGKIPTSFMDLPDWVIKSWPTLFPDGQFGRDWKRKVKLTNQNFFQQRILNKDDRFEKDKGFVFGSMSHVEAERLRNNANLTGHRGKRSELPGGEQFVEVKDPLTVLDKIPGTPKYWQKFKYDMIAKLENLGPFHMFFTLSCADMRWSANFTPVLEKLGCKLFYEVDKEGHENVTVEVVQGNVTLRLPWKKYLEEYVDAKQYDLLRQNVLLATRNFHHRVEVFRREVIYIGFSPAAVLI